MSESTHIDINGLSIYGLAEVEIYPNLVPSSGAGLDSPLKISHSNDVFGYSLRVPQGEENAVDINGCSDVLLTGAFGLGPDLKKAEGQVITIKASERIEINGVVYGVPGRQGAHVQLGQHSDQGYQTTRHVTLYLRHANGGPVYLVTGWVLPWTIHFGPGVVWLKRESVKLLAYVLAKWVVRFVLRIPRDVKGPAWM